MVSGFVIPALFLLEPAGMRAAADPAAPENPETAPLTEAEIAELSALLQADWQSSLELKIGTGWDNNLLLSELTKEESGFSRVSVEGMLWRQARGSLPVEWIGFLNASHRRMFSSDILPDDTEAFFSGEARWRPVPPVRLSLLAQGYYLDTVLDLSTESERLATPLRNAGYKAGAVARWEPGVRWWLEATGTVNRSYFPATIPEDFQERLLGVRAGWQTADGRLKLGLGANQRDRRYVARNYTAGGGRPIAGTILRYRTPEISASVERSAEWHGAWRLTGTFTETLNEDNGSGYFDYRLSKLNLTIDWTAKPWEIQFSAGSSRYHWDVQVAGIGLDPPARRRQDTTFTLHLNRELNEHWQIFAEVEREAVTSNDPLAGYNLIKFSAGFGWKL